MVSRGVDSRSQEHMGAVSRCALFIFATYSVTLIMQSICRVLLLVWYPNISGEYSIGEWFDVLVHGLSLDASVAGYISLLPTLISIAALWSGLSRRVWRVVLMIYYSIISLVVMMIVATDLELYGAWGFRIDNTIFIYLSDPKGAAASIEIIPLLKQLALIAVGCMAMIFTYSRVLRVLCVSPRMVSERVFSTLTTVLLMGLMVLAIRGGVGVSTANVSKAYFSEHAFLNHAATNPLFSLLYSLGKTDNYADQYPFFEPERLNEELSVIHCDDSAGSADSLLREARPNIVFIILEGFGSTIFEEKVGDEWVMPNLQRYKDEGVYFENMYANSFRTDRGVVALLSGFPAQTNMSIMKLSQKSSALPSIAKSLVREGYKTSYIHGGDLNFTNQRSYLYSTGWQDLVGQADIKSSAAVSKWGYADDVVGELLVEKVEQMSQNKSPFLAAWLTLSSHEPFDVPYDRFESKLLNAMSFTDMVVGDVVEQLRGTKAWEDMLVVLVPDHGFPYPEGLAYNVPLRHKIPMIWLGGAVKQPRRVTQFASQTDIAATLLSQMGVEHDEFVFSKNILSRGACREFGYYTFNDGFGVIDSTGYVVWDNIANMALEGDDQELLDIGRAMLQYTYINIEELGSIKNATNP